MSLFPLQIFANQDKLLYCPVTHLATAASDHARAFILKCHTLLLIGLLRIAF